MIDDNEPQDQVEPTDPVTTDSVENDTSYTFTIDRDAFTPCDIPPSDDGLVSLNEDYTTRSKLSSKSLKQAPGSKQDKRKYAEVIKRTAIDPVLAATYSSEPHLGGDWKQYLNSDLGKVKHGREQIKALKGTIEGDRAIARAQAAAITGTPIDIPLWTSGFTLRMAAIDEGQVFDLMWSISETKKVWAASTFGMSLSASSLVASRTLTDRILSNVMDANVEWSRIADLKKLIYVTDLPFMHLMAAKSVWVTGFELSRACVHDPEVCIEVTTGKVDPVEMYWVDNTKYTANGAANLKDKTTVRTPKDLQDFRQQHLLAPTAKVETLTTVTNGEPIKIVITVPTIHEFEQSANKWSTELESMAVNAVANSEDDEDIRNYALARANTAQLLQIAHWVSEIQFGDGQLDTTDGLDYDANIVDRDTIYDTLRSWSANDALADEIRDKVLAFQKICRPYVVGIPTYTCPKCGKSPRVDNTTHFKDIIPVDPMSAFFTHGMSVMMRKTKA